MPPHSSSAPGLAADIKALIKPGIVLWVLITVAAGYYLAAGDVTDAVLLHTLGAAALVAGASNTLNQVLERDVDALMKRTMNRPLPAGRVTVVQAMTLGLIQGALGLLWFALYTPRLTTLCAALTIGLYVLVYTPLKRVTSVATLVGAIPGALPIAGGWAASGRGWEPMTTVLFAMLFLWQLPHFLALAWIYREDYANAGLKMLSVTDGGDATFRQAFLYGVALFPASLMPAILGLVGPLYVLGASALCLWLLWVTVAAFRDRRDKASWRLFTVSVLYLPAVLILMVVDTLV
jgi:protoheme IX farnesyltransferase